MLREEKEDISLSLEEGKSKLFDTRMHIRSTSNTLQQLSERRADVENTLQVSKLNARDALYDIDQRMKDEINSKLGVPGNDVALKLTDATTLEKFSKKQFEARDLQQEKKTILNTVKRLGKSIRANSLLAGASASLAARKAAFATIKNLVNEATKYQHLANETVLMTHQSQEETDEDASDLHNEIVVSNGMLSAGKVQTDRMAALKHYKYTMKKRILSKQSMELLNQEANDVTMKYQVAWEKAAQMSKQARVQIEKANTKSIIAKNAALRFADSKAMLRIDQREENRTRAICDHFHSETIEKLGKFDTWLSGYKSHVDVKAETEATRAAGIAHLAVKNAKEARTAAGNARRREHSISILLAESKARSNDARGESRTTCRERDSYYNQLLNIRHHLTDADQWFAGVDTKALETLAETSKARCTKTTETADRAAKEFVALADKHKGAVMDVIKMTSAANAAKIAAAKEVALADQYRHHAIRRAKEKNTAWQSAVKEACDEAQRAVDKVKVSYKMMKSNHSDFSMKASEANVERKTASKLFGNTLSQQKFAREMSRLQQIALKRAIDQQILWKRNVTAFVKSKMNLEDSREKELNQKGKLPRSTRFTTDATVIEKVQQDIARRVDETDQSSNKTVRLSDETRAYSKKTLDLSNKMKLALLKVRSKEKRMAEKAKMMADTLLRMGANAMVGAAKVATKSEEKLGTAEAASPSEEAIESDIDNAASEYGKVVNKEQEEEELQEQESVEGSVLNQETKGMDLVDQSHGCADTLGFAWCEETKACYSVAEPSHCPSTISRAPAGRVLEVSDCPWCVNDENDSGSSNPHHPLFQGLLVHYMKESETNNLNWVDHQTKILNAGYNLRNETNTSIHLLIRDASESNNLFSSKKAVSTLHRMELQHEAVGDIVDKSNEEEAKKELVLNHHDAEVTTDAAKPSLEDPDEKPAPEIIQEMDSQALKEHSNMMTEAAKNELQSKENLAQTSAEKEAEATATIAMDTMKKRGDDAATLEKGVERLVAAREQLNLATSNEERQVALAALQKLENDLVDKREGATGSSEDGASGLNMLSANRTNSTDGEEEGGASITHGFTLRGVSMETVSSNAQVFQEAVVKSLTEAVSGLSKVIIEKEDDTKTEEEEEQQSTKKAEDGSSIIHVSYTVTLKKGVEPRSKSVDLVQLDVKVFTSILEANLQDSGMNIAAGVIEIIKMDKKADIENEKENSETGSEEDATGNGCVDCETDPEVTSKISNLEGKVYV
jgi:hypothetical protein